MKKIHKKIGAMALAGMVIAGGVAASGGKSHAASFLVEKPELQVSKGSIHDLSRKNQIDYDYILSYLKGSGFRILAISDNKNVMDKHIQDRFGKKRGYGKVIERLLNIPVGYFYGESAKSDLQRAKESGLRLHRFRFEGVDILASIDK